MYTLFVIGNIASGKSSACRYLSSLGGQFIDLDELAKSLYIPGSDLVGAIADEFGWDVLCEDGSVDRRLLASRVFCDESRAQRLNELVHPYLLQQLGLRLVPAHCCTVLNPFFPFTVVEISVPKAIEDAFSLADDIVAIHVPLAVRRSRAIGRGMEPTDFDDRASVQPSDEELEAMANIVIDNSGPAESMFHQLKELLVRRGVELHEKEDRSVENLS